MAGVDADGLEVRVVDPIDVALVDANKELVSHAPDRDARRTPGQLALLLGDRLEGAGPDRAHYSAACSDYYCTVAQHRDAVNA